MDSLYMPTCSSCVEMADGEDIQPLVCDNGTGMVKVSAFTLIVQTLSPLFVSKCTTNNGSLLGWFCW
jgi:hypothetical protein